MDQCCIYVTGVSVPYRNAMMLWSWIGDLTMYQMEHVLEVKQIAIEAER